MSNALHVSPVGDAVEHDLSSDEPDCVCGPSMVWVENDDGPDGWVIVHNSLNGRENAEPS